MENKAVKSDQVSSIVSRMELPAYLKKYGEENGCPVGRVRWSENQERFFGYGQGYVVAGKQLPPIPGGWELTIEETKIEKRKIQHKIQNINTIHKTEINSLNIISFRKT